MIVLHIVAWGDGCVKATVNTLLPSIIFAEPDGLLAEIDLEISTDNSSFLESCAIVHPFKSVKFFPIDATINDRYKRASAAEQKFVARSFGKTMIFLPPDFAVSKGSLSFCLNKIGDNCDMVVASAPPCVTTHPIPREATPRERAQWCWDNMHVFAQRQIWGKVPSVNHGSCVFFRCDAGYVARAHHLHPIVIRHLGTQMPFDSTVDDDLVAHIPPARAYVVTDTDNACFVELSPSDRPMLGTQACPLTVEQVKAFSGLAYIKDINRHFFKHRIIYRLRDGSTDAIDQELFTPYF